MMVVLAMINPTINLIAIMTLLVVSGCSNNASVDTAQQPVVVTTVSEVEPSALEVLSAPNATLNDADKSATLVMLHIGPNKVECQGTYLTQCMLNTPDEQSDAEFFYDTIEGFDYQWGYDYELLVSVSSLSSPMSDASNLHYELIDIIAQSEYKHKQSFDYVARYGNESIVKVAEGEYHLAGNQSMVCDPASCASIDSALAQDQSVLLDIQYGAQPGDALQLAAVVCVESRGSFNNACL